MNKYEIFVFGIFDYATKGSDPYKQYPSNTDVLTEKTTVCHYLVVRNKKCVERKTLLMGRLTDASFR